MVLHKRKGRDSSAFRRCTTDVAPGDKRTNGNTYSDRTLRRRGEELMALRSAVTESSAGSAAQHADELRRIEKKERERLLQEAGLLSAVRCTRAAKESGLADLHLPWYKPRKLRRWFRPCSPIIASNAAAIKQGAALSRIAEMLPLSSKTGSIELKPVVKLPDLAWCCTTLTNMRLLVLSLGTMVHSLAMKCGCKSAATMVVAHSSYHSS